LCIQLTGDLDPNRLLVCRLSWERRFSLLGGDDQPAQACQGEINEESGRSIMATERVFEPKSVSSFQAIMESVFYANTVRRVDIRECYRLASAQPGVIETDHPMYNARKMGLPDDAKVLVVNDGEIVGRTAKARVLTTEMGSQKAKYEGLLREAVYEMGRKRLIHVVIYMGLDPLFMVRAHYLTPESNAMNAFNVCLIFQCETEEVLAQYKKSVLFRGEPDVTMIADPDWRHPDHPQGLVIVDPDHNCVAVLGLRYFGEMK